MKAYVDKSENEFSIHCLEREDLETLMSAMAEQIGKANLVKNHIAPPQKKRLFNLLKTINNELDNN